MRHSNARHTKTEQAIQNQNKPDQTEPDWIEPDKTRLHEGMARKYKPTQHITSQDMTTKGEKRQNHTQQQTKSDQMKLSVSVMPTHPGTHTHTHSFTHTYIHTWIDR